MNIIKHNKKVSENHNKLKELCKSNISLDEFIKSLEKEDFHRKNLKGFPIFTIFFIIIIFILSAILYFRVSYIALDVVFVSIIFFSFIIFFIIRSSIANSKAVNKMIRRKALSIKYNLSFNETIEDPEYIKKYPDFHRGDYSNELEGFITTTIERGEKEYNISMFIYHYINRIEIKKKDSKGSEYRYEHYYRYGVYLEGTEKRNFLQLEETFAKFYSIPWTSSSISFNKNYKMSTDSEIDTAKYLTPVRVLKIDEIFKKYKDISFVWDGNNVCFVTSSNFLKEKYRKVNDDIPKRAELALIAKSVNMPYINNLKQDISDLI